MGFPDGLVIKKIHLLIQEIWETQVRYLGQEDFLEEEMATHSIILAWEIPWTEGRLQSMDLQRVRHDLVTEKQQHVCVCVTKSLSCTAEIHPTLH